MKLKRFLSLVLCCVLLVSFSCSCKTGSASIKPMDIEKVDTYSFDFIGGKELDVDPEKMMSRP